MSLSRSLLYRMFSPFFFICFQLRWMVIRATYKTFQQDRMYQDEHFFFDRFRQHLNMTEDYMNPFKVAVAPFFFSLGPVQGYNDRLNPLLRPWLSVPDLSVVFNLATFIMREESELQLYGSSLRRLRFHYYYDINSMEANQNDQNLRRTPFKFLCHDKQLKGPFHLMQAPPWLITTKSTNVRYA